MTRRGPIIARPQPTTQFHDRLKALRIGPYDEPTHTGVAIGPSASRPRGAVVVVMLDVSVVAGATVLLVVAGPQRR